MSPGDYKGLKGALGPATVTSVTVSDVVQGQGTMAAIPADPA